MIDRPAGGKTLQELYQQGEHYQVVNAALVYLESDPYSAEAALYAFRSYTALGLIGPALEMLEAGGSPLATLPEFCGLRGELSKMPSGRVEWDTLRQRFEANLAAIYARHPDLRQHDQAFRGIPQTLELYRALDGNWQVSTAPSKGRRRWLPDLGDAKGLVAKTRPAHDPDQPFCHPYIVTGDRFGLWFDLIHGATEKMFLTFRPRVYLVEPDIRALGVTLHTSESVDRLCDQRTSIIVGPHCVEALIELLEQDSLRAIPEYVVGGPCSDKGFQRRLVEAIRPLTTDRQRQARAAIAAVQKHYEALPAGHWPERFGQARSKSLRVLGLTSRFTTVLQYSMRDLKGAFERLGHEFRLLLDENDHDLHPQARTAEVIASFKPDLVVLIDHLWREHSQVVPANVPFVCWIQDRLPHLFKKEAGRGVRSMEFVIGYGFPECLTEFDYPADRFYPCVIPTSPEQLLDPDEGPEDLEQYRCDVMYATNACETPAELHQWHRQQYAGEGRAFVDAAFETLMGLVGRPGFCGDYDWSGLVERVERETGLAVTDHGVRREIGGLLRLIAHQWLREASIRAAARWADQTGGRFNLYGRGWEGRREFAQFARGPVEHGRPLGRAFRAARISLHAGCNSALHQRVLDGLCAGGFFLVHEKPSDLAHGLNQAIYRHVRDKGLTPPFTLRPADLPEPHAAEYRRFLTIRGSDPETGVVASREMMLNLEAECGWRCRHSASSIWPRYQEIVYRDADHLMERIDYFLQHDEERRGHAAEMRRAVLEHFTYDALVRSVVEFIGRALSGEGRSPVET
jgi:hypothetical protein